ncbi:universal stress protein [Dactylosporangium sp. NBC_01737]|uniref:universal stress protein n=1 Tax=Dactylosporangium sp. NBC_01737 TaxID=2975959 RepID=UPI002E122ECF|nr:universal stress protein [Dactylosporangium sp. NBC_01737]
MDGAAPSLEAVRWAAAEADQRHASLQLVLAYHWRVPLTAFAPSAELTETAQHLASDVVNDAAREALQVAPGIDVAATAMFGHPVQTLLRAAADAAMLVVGTRGRHGIAGAVLGSVSQQVAMHATCPVAVVRGQVHPTGGVVVGVDSSRCAAQVTNSAFVEARQRGRHLLAVRAVETPMAPCTVGMPPLMYDTAEVRRSLTDEATRLVAAVGARYPDVQWEVHGVDGDAASVLVHWTRDAQLIVVGSRGHGGFTGLLLGSVGLHLLYGAECPVLIARDGMDSGGDA